MMENETEVREITEEQVSDSSPSFDQTDINMETKQEKSGFLVEPERLQKLIFMGLSFLMLILPIPQVLNPSVGTTIRAQATILTIFMVYFLLCVIAGLVNNRVFLDRKPGKKWFCRIPLTWYCVFGLILFDCLSLLQANKSIMKFALIGPEFRGEGLLSLLSYYMIFLAASLLTNQEYRRKLLYEFLGLGCFVAVMGFLQLTKIYVMREDFCGVACSPMQNPNFFATFSLLFAGIAMAGYVFYQKDNKLTNPAKWFTRPVWLVLSVLSFISCISAFSSVVYVGLIMMFLMLIFVEIVTKNYRFLSIGILAVCFCTVMFLLHLLADGRVLSEFFSVGNQIMEEESLFGDGVGSSRMEIWKNTVKLIPEYWLLGCGIENFCIAYLKNFGFRNGFVICDRAHNEYLHMWICEGIGALISYLVFLFALFIPGLKMFFAERKKKENGKSDLYRKILFITFFGYIAQAFFNISVIHVAPYFWMFCGLLLNIYENKSIVEDRKEEEPQIQTETL